MYIYYTIPFLNKSKQTKIIYAVPWGGGMKVVTGRRHKRASGIKGF